jgi:hypothetical protein
VFNVQAYSRLGGAYVPLLFRFESFNTLHRSNPGTPNRFVNAPHFGTITDAAGPELQLGARLTFWRNLHDRSPPSFRIEWMGNRR